MQNLRAATLVIAAIVVTASSSAQTIQINRENKTVAVSATDEASTTADVAAITVGFEIFGPDANSAYAEGAKLSSAILKALHKASIQDESIESAEQGLQRNSQFNDKDSADFRAKRQFVLRQSWIVSVNPQVAGDMIRLAISAGANETGAIDWRLSNRKALQARAAENALIKARAVADKMAGGLGVKLGALIYASNETPTAKLYLARPKPNMQVADSAEVMAYADTRSLEIRPQTIREEATVYAVFAIE
jgi:uncharacterized protein YggE